MDRRESGTEGMHKQSVVACARPYGDTGLDDETKASGTGRPGKPGKKARAHRWAKGDEPGHHRATGALPCICITCCSAAASMIPLPHPPAFILSIGAVR